MKTLSILVFLLITAISLNSQTVLTVTKTGDYDPFLYSANPDDPAIVGTFQWAMRKANESATPCIIEFAIAGGGQQVIYLNYDLPTIVNSNITIDATTQPGYIWGEPSILLDGNSNFLYGIRLEGVNQVTISGIKFNNFKFSGINCYNSSYCSIINNVINNIDSYTLKFVSAGLIFTSASNNTVKGNIIGTDINYNSNLNVDGYGIVVSSSGTLPSKYNIIGGTSANEGNVIAYCGFGGINIYGSITNYNKISGNRIFNNPVAIIFYIGANNSIQPPVITSYSDNKISGTSQPNDIIEIFGSTGSENANEYFTSATADGSGNWTTTVVSNSWGYIVVTATDASGNTSALSNAKPIELPLTKLKPEFCNITTTPETILQAETVTGAIGYEFKITNTSLGFNSSIEKSNNKLIPSEVSGWEPFETYNIYVRAIFPQGVGQYGDACTVTITVPVFNTTFSPNIDATVMSKFPNNNYGNSEMFLAELKISGNPQSLDKKIARSFIQFDFAQLPAGAKIKKATLRLFGTSQTGQNSCYLQRVTAPWQENTITWNNQPTSTSFEQITLIQSSPSNKNYNIDISNFAKKWHNTGTEQNNGLLMRLQNETSYNAKMGFASSDNVDDTKTPLLDIDYYIYCPATISANGPTTFCEGGSVQLTASNGTAWLWSNGSTTQSIYVSESGNYSVSVSDGNGCEANASIQTTEVDLPVAFAGNDTSIYEGQSAQIGTNPISNYSYQWTPSIGLSNSSIANPFATTLLNQLYVLNVTNEFECFANDSVFVNVIKPTEGEFSQHTAVPTDDSPVIYDRFGNTYSLDEVTRGSCPTGWSTGATDATIGFFNLSYCYEPSQNNPYTTDIINVINTVFQNISGLLVRQNCGGNLPLVNIHINAPAGMDAANPGAASQFYTPGHEIFTNLVNENSGVLYGDVWRAINTGLNNPLLFDAKVEINLYNLAWTFNTDLTQNTTDVGVEIDLYSVLLHEVIHSLGFASLIDENGQSRLNATNFYSKYDTYLQSSGVDLIDWDNMYNTQFNTALSPASDLQKICPDVIQFNGINSANLPIANFNDGAISHFGCLDPANLQVMKTGIGTGQEFRTPTCDDVNVLKDLGYQTTGVWATTQICTASAIGVIGRNDGFYQNNLACSQRIILDLCEVGTDAITINFADILANDINANSVTGLQMLGTNGAFISDANSFTYTPSQAGLVYFRYIPVNTNTSQIGNATAVVIEVFPCNTLDGCLVLK